MPAPTPRNFHPRPNPRGFTLVELLVSIAILALLTLIGLPNMLEAQTRAKVSRAKADIHTLMTGIEAYAADNHRYPLSGPVDDPRMRRLQPLTTPVAYVAAIPRDPFDTADEHGIEHWRSGIYNYGSKLSDQSKYALSSDGPDRRLDYNLIWAYPGFTPDLVTDASNNFVEYDPTNGTISRGDILRASDYAAW